MPPRRTSRASAAESELTKQFCERILDCHPAALATEARMVELAREIVATSWSTNTEELAALVIDTFGEKK